MLVNQNDAALVTRGATETLALCDRTPAITDLDTIHVIQDALRQLSVQNKGSGSQHAQAASPDQSLKLWERAAAALGSPRDDGAKTRALLLTWMNSCIERAEGSEAAGVGGWKGAQKVW